MATRPQPLSVQNGVGTERKNNKLKTLPLVGRMGSTLNRKESHANHSPLPKPITQPPQLQTGARRTSDADFLPPDARPHRARLVRLGDIGGDS